MTLQEYLEKQMQDPEFGKAYEDTQPEIDAIRTSIDGANAGFNQETEETMKEVDIPVSSLTDALSGVFEGRYRSRTRKGRKADGKVHAS